MNRDSHSVFDEKRGIIMGYLGPGEDLITGLKKACQKHNVSSGTVSCIGSLSTVSVYQPEYENDQPAYSKPIVWNSLVELLSGNGILGKDEEGHLDIHFHGVFIDHRKNLSGGHFIEGKNIVAITVEFTILVSEGIQPVREFYKPLGYHLFNFYNESEV
ncbi:DNA-binding protein [Bacillus sp. FJAT-29790]|uniref:PPC domain-containing DNA-binding protein n=1 Tax=Bacillus sp. FJAT-29790 TaxID=1895002 RepID=UPI001C23EAD3|nr:PPC domain-containing DNA-binding protein [Bacillus sp. FJAT-29790]MBU8878732.1 DNA-binding protein [Bacillus sp. FJAT-29790]